MVCWCWCRVVSWVDQCAGCNDRGVASAFTLTVLAQRATTAGPPHTQPPVTPRRRRRCRMAASGQEQGVVVAMQVAETRECEREQALLAAAHHRRRYHRRPPRSPLPAHWAAPGAPLPPGKENSWEGAAGWRQPAQPPPMQARARARAPAASNQRDRAPPFTRHSWAQVPHWRSLCARCRMGASRP